MNLEQSCDGKSGDAPVAVRDEVLKVNVAWGHSVRVDHGNAVERLHGSKTNGRLRWRQEHLQDCETVKVDGESLASFV